MKRKIQSTFLFFTASLLIGSIVLVSQTANAQVKTLNSFTTNPFKNSQENANFPYGLTWANDSLWVASNSEEKIFQINVNDGGLMKVITPGAKDPESLAWDGNNLWVGDDQLKKIYKINPQTGEVLQTFELTSAKGVDGLAWDGENLWTASEDQIAKINPSSGEILTTYNFPQKGFEALEWVNDSLLAGDETGKSTYKIDPNSGEITETFDLKDIGAPEGLAWNPNTCTAWVTVENTKMIFEVDLGGSLTKDSCTACISDDCTKPSQ